MEAFTRFPLLDPWCEFSWKIRAIRNKAFKNGTASNKQDPSQTPTNESDRMNWLVPIDSP